MDIIATTIFCNFPNCIGGPDFHSFLMNLVILYICNTDNKLTSDPFNYVSVSPALTDDINLKPSLLTFVSSLLRDITESKGKLFY